METKGDNLENVIMLLILKVKMFHPCMFLEVISSHKKGMNEKLLLVINSKMCRVTLLYESLHFNVLHNWLVVSYCSSGDLNKIKNVYFVMYNLYRECRLEVLQGETDLLKYISTRPTDNKTAIIFSVLGYTETCLVRLQPPSNVK